MNVWLELKEKQMYSLKVQKCSSIKQVPWALQEYYQNQGFQENYDRYMMYVCDGHHQKLHQ